MRIVTLIIFTSLAFSTTAQVKIGDNPSTTDGSALLELESSDKGFLPPRVPDPLAISNPAPGLQVLNTTTGCIQMFYAGVWQNVFCACNQAPENPIFLAGVTSACPGETGLQYAVSPVSGASSYEWTLPDGWSIESGSGTNQIMATAGQSGIVSVSASNPCGVSAPTEIQVAISGNDSPGSPQVFTYTGADQFFVVPDCVSSINVKAWGAGGGGYNSDKGGGGGFASADFEVTPGQQLRIVTGEGGAAHCNGECSSSSSLSAAAFGGGAGATYGNGGGGYSGIFINTTSPLLIAGGGGGGGGGNTSGWGGAGGDVTGQPANGGVHGGGGGSQSAGGTAGQQTDSWPVASAGGYLQGGNGSVGGGGGGGYYGGGGGARAGHWLHRGGGGGSSWISTSGSSNVVNTGGSQEQPANASDPAYISGVGLGGSSGAGGNGLVVISW